MSYFRSSLILVVVTIAVVNGFEIDSERRLLTIVAAAIAVLLLGASSTGGRVCAVTLTSAALFSVLRQTIPVMLNAPLAKMWWPWPSAQPVTTITFIVAWLLCLAMSEQGRAFMRPAAAVASSAAVAFYSFGSDISLVTGRPWLFELVGLSAPALLAFLPVPEGGRRFAMLFGIAEPFVAVLLAWAALLPVLRPGQMPVAFLMQWLWPTFAVPAALAALLAWLVSLAAAIFGLSRAY